MALVYRLSLALRLSATLAGIAAFSTVLALVLQDRSLSADLGRAAERRLDRAADATQLLFEGHLATLEQRYRAVSGTPQFRATIEVDDEATLRFYAARLASTEGAAFVAFVDAEDRAIVVVGRDALPDAVVGIRTAALVGIAGEPYAVARIPLRTDGQRVGSLIAAERIDDDVVSRWSDLCGAEVSFAARDEATSGNPTRVVASLGDLELRVDVSLDAEREALAHSRANLLAAGGIALALAFAGAVLIARGVVRPIVEIRHATERIGDGDFDTRFVVKSTRTDEIGDVARAFDTMLDRLSRYREQVERQREELEENLDRLRKSQEQLANAQQLAHVGSWQMDLATGELTGSDEFRAIFGLTEIEKGAPPRSALAAVHPDDREALESALWACIREGSTLRSDCRIRLRGSTDRILHLQAQVRHDDQGRAALLEGTVQDVTERKRSEQQIRYLAYHDSLTGLGNRLLCRERLELQIAQARRNEETLGVLFLDLDQFKRINDTLGHSVGDELLKGVADRLVASVRETDVISRGEVTSAVARLGGDEFTVILPAVRDVQDLALVARRILAMLSRPFELQGHEVVISGSIGITAFPFDGDDAESILRNADVAMYHAKESGRNNYQFYAESMNEVALRLLILEGKLRHGLERDEFELHYQPKIAAPTGDVVGVEALIRWRDPDAGLISPGVFIPIAEETGLISPLGDWVVREACRQITRWAEAGHRVPVSVNLSAQQFRKGGLPGRIAAIMEECDVEPALLELEITESTLMHDQQAVVGDLEKLRASGLRISVDDFGTGYSSLSYLRQLPVDALKIDRSFIAGIASNPDDAALTASIISMAKALRLHVIAEGVETQEQYDLLVEWECDEIQGFYCGRPDLPAVVERRFGRATTRG